MKPKEDKKRILEKLKWTTVGALVTIAIVLLPRLWEKTSLVDFGFGASSDKFKFEKVNPEFTEYISAFTSGYISSGSTIKVKFASQLIENVITHQPLSEAYFTFDEDIEGITSWLDEQTLEFKPKNRLEPGKVFNATLHLGKLIDVKKELSEFKFKFKIVNQSIKVEFNELKCYQTDDFTYYKSSGTIYTADYADAERIEKIIQASFDKKNLSINWRHDDNNSHYFWIDSLERGTVFSSKLKYVVNGSEIKVQTSETKEFEIPTKNSFVLMNASVVKSPEQFIQLTFSNPLDKNQSLEGLIGVKDLKNVKYVVENNQVRIYPNDKTTGKFKLKIAESVLDANANSLGKMEEVYLLFEEIKPSVKFIGSGSILPSSGGTGIHFEAVNLRAVDVKITKIFSNNILQFLQENDLNGQNELARVGKRVLSKTINLGITNPADFRIKKRFTLDIASLIKAEPGAIYRVKLSFNKSHSAFVCNGSSNNSNIEMETMQKESEENEYGYYYDYDYAYYNEEDYDWQQSDNPCNPAFYSDYKISASKNILASDLGLTVKKSNDGYLFFATSNLVTTEPETNVEIELYDYQQQLITQAKTDSKGLLFLQIPRNPFFVVAKNKHHVAYTKLEDGASLSLSMFDVGGQAVQKGLKGMLYGERGVWRPGDTLFLSFILEDKLKTLPKNHPVVLELKNPQGMIYKKLLKNLGLHGFYSFLIPTDAGIPTGNWTAICKVGAIEFNKNIRIETVMPNRLKLKVNAGDNKLLTGTNEQLSISANWLTGIKASNLPAKVALAINKNKTEFEGFAEYIFDDATSKFETQNLTVYDGKLNESGNASVILNLKTEGTAPGMLKANFVTRVTELGGAFSSDRFSVTYSPYSTYVGIKLPKGENKSGILQTGKTHKINVVTLNPQGKRVGGKKLSVAVYKMSWRWWWEQYEDEYANYSFSEYNKPIFATDITTTGGDGEFELNFNDEDWGRYLIKVSDANNGHSSSAVVFFDSPGWMERGGNEGRIMASVLQFSSDKKNYKTGDEVTINIPSPKGGRALVTIETGSKILQANWLETIKGTTVFKFKITPDMAPTAYVHVSLLQPHLQVENDLPIRLYGTIPVLVDDPETHLRPVLTMPSVLEPESVTNVTVAEENGKEMVYTIAMVDEGLLDLTRFKTPEVWSSFFAREALGVKTWDVYDFVLGAYSGELERVLSIGGDGTEINKDAAKANRFKPMVKFLGPFKLNKGEKKQHKIKMPMYIGSVRTMVIAGYEGAYGTCEKTTPVKSPVMILGTLPRVLSINDEVVLPVSVFGGEANLKNVRVKVSCNSLVQIIGQAEQLVDVNKNEEKIVYFKMKVKQQTGVAKIEIKATSSSKSTNYTMELDVRNPNPIITDVKDYSLESGKTLDLKYSGIGLIGSNSGAIEVSSMPAVNLETRLNYLISYPHGCLEQTSSAAFAQLNLENIIALSGERKNEVEKNIRAAISSLQKFQLSNGEFAYWPGLADVNAWADIYATHFLISAEKAGYLLPVQMKQNMLNNHVTKANAWEPGKSQNTSGDFIQAYRLFVLSLTGKSQLSAMNRLREMNTLSQQAKWRLAAAYSMIGANEVAEKLIEKARPTINEYGFDYSTFGSAFRDEAMILETLCMLGKKAEALTLFKKLAQQLSSSNYLNTQSTAFGLVATAKCIQLLGRSSSLQIDLEMNGINRLKEGNSAIISIPLDYKKSRSGNMTIKNNGKGTIYIKLINQGQPLQNNLPESQMNVITEITYKRNQNEIITPENLKQGTSITLEVLVKNPGTSGIQSNLAMQSIVAAGWEIQNTRLDGIELNQHNIFDYQDIRDDRVNTYFSLKANEAKLFRFKFIASYAGKYYMPGVSVTSMYDPTVYSFKKGMLVNINN